MKDFLWGSATASYQCEGGWNEKGKVDSMWDVYLHENNLENGDIASDHFHRFEEDIRMLKEGGQNAYRFSLSWPRIIKNLDGDVNEEGIEHYHKVIYTCLKYGVDPFVTLYHWDLPQYLEELGGWLNPITRDKFVDFARVVYKAYNGKIKHWTTFNEPKWFIFSGYMSGNYPPGHKNPQEVIEGAYNVMTAHAMAVKAFREMKIEGEIGIVASYEMTYPTEDTEECRQAVRYANLYSNLWVTDPAVKGKFPEDLAGKLKAEGFDLSFVNVDDLNVIKENKVDFIGLNYYSPRYVKPYTTGETELIINNSGAAFKGKVKTVIKNWFEVVNDTGLPTNAWNMDIFPQGIYDTLKKNHDLYKIPLYITENGLGAYEDVSVDMVQDDGRIDYIESHAKEVIRAKKDGIDVRGYFVWSTFDLYSWKNGCEKRYGLVAVDFENGCIRKPKASYYRYKQMIESNME